MTLAIILILLILIPTFIAALLLAMAWMLKHSPAMILEYQSLFINGGIISGIILLIPLLIGVVVLVATLWGKIKKDK